MLLVYPIVEGHGEEAAVPILLRRIAAEIHGTGIEVVRPFRLGRNHIARRSDELRRVIGLIGSRLQRAAGPTLLLVLLDADDDCPATLGPAIFEFVAENRPGVHCSVVVAKSEYEAWLLASAESLRTHPRVRDDAACPADPEAIRDAKGAVERLLLREGESYAPSVDQAVLTSLIDFRLARRASSFDKLMRELDRAMTRATNEEEPR